MTSDPLFLTQTLIRFPSVTPDQQGSLDFIESYLQNLGFTCHRLIFGNNVHNLYARFGTTSPHFCFAGHVDVVPPGPLPWQHNPFSAVIFEDILYGRGSVDMKGAIGAFLGALHDFMQNPFSGSISLLLTADEEGIATYGTQKVLEWLKSRNEIFDHCLIGEPSSQNTVGDMIKVGRRGSLNTHICFEGTQGHVAYPNLADNPIPRALNTLQTLLYKLPQRYSAHFDPTHLEITSIDTGNLTVNVIPGSISAHFNIRLNDQISTDDLKSWIQEICEKEATPYTCTFQVSGEADICMDDAFIKIVQKAIFSITGLHAECSTRGGTSDGRFIRHYAPVLEFGLQCSTMHQVNECVPVKDLYLLKKIYGCILDAYFTPLT